MRLAAVTLAAVLAASAAVAQEETFVRKDSPHDVETTVERIAETVEQGGGKVFARLDHAEAAAEYDLEMAPTTVIVFGNPKVGTPMMQENPTLALDLPLKVLVREGENGVEVVYREPATWLGDHGMESAAEGMAGMLDKITDRAVAAE
ncbi:MAG: DUF302 domain-containing protein [Paracoccaceae bacterium]